MTSIARPWRAEAGGLTVVVRLIPKGGRDAIEGIENLSDGRVALKVRVRAAPHEGAANEALTRLLANSLGVPKRQVSLIAGATTRIKRVQVVGAPAALAGLLEKLCADGSLSN
jgi:uncharacterized protein YggU (UPF0235/DUF167 family)